MLDLLVLAIIAGFIFSKLFKILGNSDDDVQRYQGLDPIIEQLRKKNTQEKNVADIEIVSAVEAALPEQLRLVCDKIRVIDNSFSMDSFYKGVRKAFNIIIESFTKGDESTLQRLLSKAVLDHFSKDIARRKETKQVLEKIIVGVNNIEAESALINGTYATISVKITSEQITVLKDHLGNILDGHPTKVAVVNDLWTFAKDLRKEKVWLLTSTS